MTALSRWLAPAVLAAGFGFAALVPAPAQAQDDTLTRVIVDVADVVLRGGQPYYRYGNYGNDDRLIVRRDRYGRPVYYRLARVDRYDNRYGYNNGYYGNRYNTGYGYYDPTSTARRVKCNRNGNCTVTYYDARYDRRGDYHSHRRHDGRRWRGRDDD